jgi:phospholipase C
VGEGLSRRELLTRGARLGAAAAFGLGAASVLATPASAATTTTRARGRALRAPGSLPNPRLRPGTDTIPKIEHIVVLMMENHSYDNYLGVLPRGDGLRLDRHGVPTATNPDANGVAVRSFRMPSTCQAHGRPTQTWDASHTSFDGGRNDGFVRASGHVAMGYWTGEDLPYYYELARTFPLCDRWFASCLAQTYPNRRFLVAGTAAGLVNNSAALAPSPANGLVFDQLDAHGITWKDYYSNVPTAGLFASAFQSTANIVGIDQFFNDAAAGSLPAVSLVDPDFEHDSEEDPQDIRVGEAFAARVIAAVMHGPAWPKTVLIWCYDEHGGYYDHVPPPVAVAPDSILPATQVPPDQPGGYDRYGFRVPALVVSPYARPRHVSHVVRDHTAILKLIETKWNLPALTYRDANSDDLLDCLDLHGKPAFLRPPTLPDAPATADPAACQAAASML